MDTLKEHSAELDYLAPIVERWERNRHEISLHCGACRVRLTRGRLIIRDVGHDLPDIDWGERGNGRLLGKSRSDYTWRRADAGARGDRELTGTPKYHFPCTRCGAKLTVTVLDQVLAALDAMATKARRPLPGLDLPFRPGQPVHRA